MLSTSYQSITVAATGECFGLLGVNGAGKTTTFSMLTGDTTISSGDAFLSGTSVLRGAAGARQRLVGYCPQFDALIDQMTVRETLWMYARLRGIHSVDIDGVVEKLIDQLTLEKYGDRQAGRLRYTRSSASICMMCIGHVRIILKSLSFSTSLAVFTRYVTSHPGQLSLLSSLEEEMCTEQDAVGDGKFRPWCPYLAMSIKQRCLTSDW